MTHDSTPRRPARPACQALGRGARDAAHRMLEARRESVILAGRRALLLHLLAHGTAVADDVRAAVDIPPGVDPVALGAVPGALARARIVERAGYIESSRPEAHARPVSVWRLVDRDAAQQWLRDHPAAISDPVHRQPSEPTAGSQRTLFDVDADPATAGGM